MIRIKFREKLHNKNGREKKCIRIINKPALDFGVVKALKMFFLAISETERKRTTREQSEFRFFVYLESALPNDCN